MNKVWSWIKAHAPLLLAGGVGLVAAYYLLLKPSGKSQAPSTVQFPAGGGGAGGGGGTPTPTAGLPCITTDGKIGATDSNGNCVALAVPPLPDGSPCFTSTLQVGTMSNGVCVAPAPTAPPPPITAPPIGAAATVTASDITNWQNLFLTLPSAAQTFNTWVQDAPTLLRSTFNLTQLQQIYNYFNAQSVAGVRYTTAQVVDLINGWLANPATIPTGTTTTAATTPSSTEGGGAVPAATTLPKTPTINIAIPSALTSGR